MPTEPRVALETLLSVTRDLTSSMALQDALHRVSDAALTLLQGDHSSIRVLDRTRTELLCGARSGVGADVEPLRRLRGEGLAGWVVDHAEPVAVDDVTRDPRFVDAPEQGFEVGSLVAVPLLSSGEAIGVLSVSSKRRSAFEEDDLMLASVLANCAVPAIEKARLARLAVTDPRTMAFNVSYLLPALHQQMERLRGSGLPLALLLIDLDRFKKVNDTLGHAAGDTVLEEFARRLRAATRERDIVVRRGGDEFVLVMPGATRDVAVQVAERIRSEVGGRPITMTGGATVTQTVSIGGAVWDGLESPEALEERADRAMYSVKQHGRDAVGFD